MSDDSRRLPERQGPRIVAVGEADAGQRIDNYLVKKLKDVPKSRIYQMIRKGEVRVNGGRVKPTRKLLLAEQVRIPPVVQRPKPVDTFIGSHQLALIEGAIIHEDERLIVVNKPSGLAVHGGSGVSFGLIEGLRRLRPGADLELVHRLDRDTSGVLLVAKRRSQLRTLHEHIRAGRLGKFYRMIVRGQWPGALRRVDAPLSRYLSGGGERRVRVDAEGKPSLTTFEVDARAPEATLLTAQLHTGRTHQIRVHCQSAGHPIVGDEKYVTEAEQQWDKRLRVGRLCLHAARIIIPGSKEGDEAVQFQAPLPEDFSAIWQRLARSGSSVSEDG